MMNKTQIAVVSSLIAALILPTFTSYAQTHPLEVPPKAQNRAQNSLEHLGHGIAPSPSVVAPVSFQATANLIKQTYESQLFTLRGFKEGHYALRMYR